MLSWFRAAPSRDGRIVVVRNLEPKSEGMTS